MYFGGNILHLPIWFAFVYKAKEDSNPENLKCADAENKAIYS